MTNLNIDDQGRPEPPVSSDEVSTLLGFLEFQRATLEWKCRKLGSIDLQKKIAASSMTLGGILKHMAYVENHWFSDWLMGRDKLSPWREVDWSQDRDWDWNSAASDSPEQLAKLWHNACELSRLNVASTIKIGDLGQLAPQRSCRFASRSNRWPSW
jgi:hypothetical protein